MCRFAAPAPVPATSGLRRGAGAAPVAFSGIPRRDCGQLKLDIAEFSFSARALRH
jgi:hypothetical protein